MNELFNLFIVGLVINLILFIQDLLTKNYTRIYSFILFGSIAAILDIIVEFAGTYNLFWTYNESIYFIFGLIPIELPAIFFTSAVIGKFLHSKIIEIKWKLNLNFIFLLLSIIGFSLYISSNIMFEIDDSLIVFTLPIGIWGFNNFKNESHKSMLLIIAVFVGLIDFYIESWIISSGNYDYSAGFKLITPINYFLLTLAMFGLMQFANKKNKTH